MVCRKESVCIRVAVFFPLDAIKLITTHLEVANLDIETLEVSALVLKAVIWSKEQVCSEVQ